MYREVKVNTIKPIKGGGSKPKSSTNQSATLHFSLSQCVAKSSYCRTALIKPGVMEAFPVLKSHLPESGNLGVCSGEH